MADSVSNVQDVPQPQALQESAQAFRMSVTLKKVLIIAGLAIAMLLPMYFVSGLIDERESRQKAVQGEIASGFGPAQRVEVPTLVLPYQIGNGPQRYVRIAPSHLTVVATLSPQERRRGLFQANVYESQIEFRGAFDIPESRLRDFTEKGAQFLWEQSFVVLVASKVVGLAATDALSIEGGKTPWIYCREAQFPEQHCRNADVLVARANLTPEREASQRSISFAGSISLRGTGSFSLGSWGRELDAVIKSPWTTPSFIGEVLPTSSSVTSDGFEAHWQIAAYETSHFVDASSFVETAPDTPSIGVSLLEAVPIYRMIHRAAKYAPLLVALSFATYFFFEILSGLRIHPVQYGLLGLSLSLFALLLLSIGEIVGYTAGFIASAGLVLIQASAYTAAIARRPGPALVFAAMLATLFAFIYVLLSLETYSLLVGALALFIVLSVLMSLVQKMSWLAEDEPRRASA